MLRQIACLLLLGFVTAASGANIDAVTATLDARIVEQKPGGKVLSRAAYRARPGDVVEYQLTYTNTGDSSVRGVVATLPIPPGSMEYVLASAQPNAVLASVDGKLFAPVPLWREMRGADGQTRTEAIPLQEYRYLRWYLGALAAGESTVVTARMQVITAPDDTLAGIY